MRFPSRPASFRILHAVRLVAPGTRLHLPSRPLVARARRRRGMPCRIQGPPGTLTLPVSATEDSVTSSTPPGPAT